MRKALVQDLNINPEHKKAVKLLKTIPGVGQISATTVVAEIGDIQRFHSPKALCNWAGLTPRIRNSSGFTRHGRISKEGSPFLRGAMTRAAAVASRKSKRWYVAHENLVKRCGKKVAKEAIGRRLLTIAYYMLKRNQPFSFLFRLPTRLPQATIGSPETIFRSPMRLTNQPNFSCFL